MSKSVDSLKRRLAARESTSSEISELEGAIDSAFHVSRELIALGRPSPPAERRAVDVNELVTQFQGVLTGVLGPDIGVSLQLDAVDAAVEAEAVQLEWVFLNLATNSREAMPNGGAFTIQTSLMDRQMGSSRTRRYIRVTVSDTGHGLFGEARARAFDPFFTTKDGAPGLGLTSVAMIVRSFRGWLHIESDPSGTRIHLHLPARPSE
jgi:signal transduction histidine kinase